MRSHLILCCLALIVFGCTNPLKEKIQGHWEIVKFQNLTNGISDIQTEKKEHWFFQETSITFIYPDHDDVQIAGYSITKDSLFVGETRWGYHYYFNHDTLILNHTFSKDYCRSKSTYYLLPIQKQQFGDFSEDHHFIEGEWTTAEIRHKHKDSLKFKALSLYRTRVLSYSISKDSFFSFYYPDYLVDAGRLTISKDSLFIQSQSKTEKYHFNLNHDTLILTTNFKDKSERLKLVRNQLDDGYVNYLTKNKLTPEAIWGIWQLEPYWSENQTWKKNNLDSINFGYPCWANKDSFRLNQDTIWINRNDKEYKYQFHFINYYKDCSGSKEVFLKPIINNQPASYSIRYRHMM